MARTRDEQTNSLANYFPPGRAFASVNAEGTVARALLAGLSGELVRSEALVEEFRDQIIPDKTVLYVDEWERALGIPDDCFQGTGSLDERRADVLAKLASLGVQTNEDFRRLALQAYGVELTLVNPSRSTDNIFPYVFNPTGEPDPNNDGGSFVFNLSDREARFQLVIVYNNLPTAVVFPYTFPMPFGTREQAIIECLFTKLRPANVGFTKEVPIPQTSPVPQPIPPSPPPISAFALEFLASNPDRLATSPFLQDFNIPNPSTAEFSISVWARRVTGAGSIPSKTIFQFGRGPGNSENIFSLTHNSSTQILAARVFDDTGSGSKIYESSQGVPAIGDWFMFTMTYDGANAANSFQLYLNDTLDATPTKATDQDISALSQINLAGSIGTSATGTLGQDGTLYSIATWDSELSAAEVAAIYNGGDASVFDLLDDEGNYVSSANLQDWFLTGKNPSPDLAGNVGPNGVSLSIEINLTDADRTSDIPTPP